MIYLAQLCLTNRAIDDFALRKTQDDLIQTAFDEKILHLLEQMLRVDENERPNFMELGHGEQIIFGSEKSQYYLIKISITLSKFSKKYEIQYFDLEKLENRGEKIKNGDMSQISVKQDTKPFEPKTAFNNGNHIRKITLFQLFQWILLYWSNLQQKKKWKWNFL